MTQTDGKVIRFNEPYLTGNEMTYIKQVFENNHFQGNGPFTQKCQGWLKDYLGVPHVLLTDSCTSALEISALLLKQQPTDEVILPSYTFSSTASAFARAGYTLRFAEIDPATMMMDVDHVKALTGANTRAIVPVHYAGIPANLSPLMRHCERHDIDLVEDAAQALGSVLGSKKMGTFGRLACFSFHETKNIHAGLAGALAINDESLIDRATYIWERGTNRQAVLQGLVDKYTWVEVGGSFYPSELQAAFLFAQLEGLAENIEGRRPLFDAYVRGLSPLQEQGLLSLPPIPNDLDFNHHACFVIFRSADECQKVRKHLVAQQIHAYIGYIPLHSSPVGQSMGYVASDLPVTEEYAARVLRLPMHHKMTADDAINITQQIQVALTHDN